MDWSPHIVVKAEDVQSVPTSVAALKTFGIGFPDTKATVHCIGIPASTFCKKWAEEGGHTILGYPSTVKKSQLHYEIVRRTRLPVALIAGTYFAGFPLKTASQALLTIDGAIDHINNQRSDLGAISNRLDKTINNLTNVVENTTESLSHIRDANFAAETSKLTKAQILNQAATSMLAQANASKQTVLALLQN